MHHLVQLCTSLFVLQLLGLVFNHTSVDLLIRCIRCSVSLVQQVQSGAYAVAYDGILVCFAAVYCVLALDCSHRIGMRCI
jgi:hypothetical protein